MPAYSPLTRGTPHAEPTYVSGAARQRDSTKQLQPQLRLRLRLRLRRAVLRSVHLRHNGGLHRGQHCALQAAGRVAGLEQQLRRQVARPAQHKRLATYLHLTCRRVISPHKPFPIKRIVSQPLLK